MVYTKNKIWSGATNDILIKAIHTHLQKLKTRQNNRKFYEYRVIIYYVIDKKVI